MITGKKIMSSTVFSAFFMVIMLMVFYPLAQTQQTKDKLLDKKKHIEEEIAYYKKLIEETKKTKNISLNQLVLLKNQISVRENLIGVINIEMSELDSKIIENMEEVQRSTEQVKALKEEYAKMVYNAYKNRSSFDRLMFIFASTDFNQAHRRLKYLQQYNQYLRHEVELISNTTNQILQTNKELEKQKNSKQELLVSSQAEKLKLAKEKEKKDADLKKLKKTETELKKTLKQKEEEARILRRKIESAISEEIKKSAVKTNKTVTTTTTVKNVLTPEEIIATDNFAGNKGRLPWPLERGAITATYGEHPHPVLDGIKVKNNGIDISTSSGAVARAVFAGIVAGVVTITNNNKAVIIRHGEYFTVYSNLMSVSVKKDQKVAIKQTVGTINTGSDDNKTELHFEVWQGKLTCNPVDWISKR
jgi:murein hydrolase activator